MEGVVKHIIKTVLLGCHDKLVKNKIEFIYTIIGNVTHIVRIYEFNFNSDLNSILSMETGENGRNNNQNIPSNVVSEQKKSIHLIFVRF